jgi:hypothetical protein
MQRVTATGMADVDAVSLLEMLADTTQTYTLRLQKKVFFDLVEIHLDVEALCESVTIDEAQGVVNFTPVRKPKKTYHFLPWEWFIQRCIQRMNDIEEVLNGKRNRS